MKTQTLNLKWLLNRGYNVSQAARILSRSPEHVRQVLAGTRRSKNVETALRALPRRELKLRRPITAK